MGTPPDRKDIRPVGVDTDGNGIWQDSDGEKWNSGERLTPQEIEEAEEADDNYPCGKPDRVPICIAPETRKKLLALLFTDEFRGVGYTEFVERAIVALAPGFEGC